jgi:hypothetical protein
VLQWCYSDITVTLRAQSEPLQSSIDGGPNARDKKHFHKVCFVDRGSMLFSFCIHVVKGKSVCDKKYTAETSTEQTF